jgi:hypothetical protein
MRGHFHATPATFEQAPHLVDGFVVAPEPNQKTCGPLYKWFESNSMMPRRFT